MSETLLPEIVERNIKSFLEWREQGGQPVDERELRMISFFMNHLYQSGLSEGIRIGQHDGAKP